MNTTELIKSIDTVSKQVKTKISKIGKDSLFKRLESGKLETKEEVIAALFYSKKRGFSLKEMDATLAQYSFLQEEKKEKSVKKERTPKPQVQENEILLTKNELDVLTVLMKLSKKNAADKKGVVSMKSFEKEIEKIQNDISVRVKKGYLGAVVKKNLIIGYNQDEIFLSTEESNTFDKIVAGELILTQKRKYQRSNILAGRISITIDGKSYDKSRFIRKILREDVHATPKSINERLASEGFPKMYHSELLRCKKHLNMK